MPKQVTILIPTYNRPCSLTTLLTSLCAQTFSEFDIIISDQSDQDILTFRPLGAVIRVLNLHNNQIHLYKHLPRRGIAEQRQFLFEQSSTKYVLFLDDDLILEPWVIESLFQTISTEDCGFVGQAVIGLSFRDEIRPDEQVITWWQGPVKPEVVRPHTHKWQRYVLHNAANILHVQEKYNIDISHPKTYKVAWIGGCVLYNTNKLKRAGGFSFWKDLPVEHTGEDALAQIHVMQKYGGCGVLPSGVYHQELTTTIPNRFINAPEYLQ